MAGYQLDQKDKQIVKYLFEDGRMSIADIAKKTKLQRDTVARRIKQLRGTNTITSFGPSLDSASLGLPNFAVILLKTKVSPKESKDRLVKKLAGNEYIFHIAKIVSNYDYFVMLVYRDTTHLNYLVDEIRSFVPDFIENLDIHPIAKEYKFQDMSQLL